MDSPDPREELATLTAALYAHVEMCRQSGAFGLPAATAELAARRAEASSPEEKRSVHENSFAERGAPPEPKGGSSRHEATRSSSADPAHRLSVLSEEVRACTRCGLHSERKQAVFSRGTGAVGLMFVGEGPGADEDEQGFPFVGKAGQLLDRMIDAMGFGRDEVYVCNIVKCRPPKNRKPEPDEMAACRPFLIEQIELLDPKVIVALGATAVEGLLGVTGGITRLRGTWRLYQGKVPVMPTFHPAYLLRTPEAKRLVWQDLQEVLRQMGRTVPSKK